MVICGSAGLCEMRVCAVISTNKMSAVWQGDGETEDTSKLPETFRLFYQIINLHLAWLYIFVNIWFFLFNVMLI